MPINYQNSKIYSIRSPNIEDYYIGSTTQLLCQRFNDHVKTCKYNTQGSTSKKIIEAGEAYIELIETYPCNSKEELLKREGEIMRLHLDNIVNRCIAGRDTKTYWIDNKTIIAEKRKTKYENNKTIILEKQKQYLIANKEHINEMRRNKYLLNKEHINEIRRNKYLLNNI